MLHWDMLFRNLNFEIMRILKCVLASSVLPVMLCGCRNRSVDDGGRASDDATECLDTTNCLNGYYIVSGGSGEGVVDAAGGVVVPVSCERLYFIEDDVIAGFSGGNWRFFSTAGDVIAEMSGAADEAPEMLFDKYVAARREQERVWEGIVCGYERFCERCAVEGSAFGDMKTVADSLRAGMQVADGQMSEGQRRRVEQAYGKYREGRAL